MTEQEWTGSSDPTPMLEYLRGKATDRKLRLFAVACCRSIWHLMTDDGSKKAVEAADRVVDGLSSKKELEVAFGQAGAACGEMFDAGDGSPVSAWYSARAAFSTSNDGPSILGVLQVAWETAGAASTVAFEWDSKQWDRILCEEWIESGRNLKTFNRQDAAYEVGWDAFVDLAGWADERKAQASFLCDIFGTLPFRPVRLDPAWLTSTVIKLGEAIYGDRAFDQMPILGDALEDAGCTNADILDHCRASGPHVRGCWGR